SNFIGGPMSDRRVKVIFEAELAQYAAAMKEASRSTEDLKKKIDGTGDATAKQGKALKTLAPLMMGVGTAGVAAFGLAIKTAADFDKAMSSVQAATHESAENMGLLREAAIKAGADTAFSA